MSDFWKRRVLKHKYELIGAAVGIAILASFSVPRFLRAQTSDQVKTVQERLNYMVETMMDNPMIFIDTFIQEHNGGRETDFPSCITTIKMEGSKLRPFFPNIEWSNMEQRRTYYVSGGDICGNRDEMKKRNWDWKRHFVCAHVYMNGDRSPSLEVQVRKNSIMYMPKSDDLYNSSNGLGSEGIVYAHSYEMHRSKDSDHPAGSM